MLRVCIRPGEVETEGSIRKPGLGKGFGGVGRKSEYGVDEAVLCLAIRHIAHTPPFIWEAVEVDRISFEHVGSFAYIALRYARYRYLSDKQRSGGTGERLRSDVKWRGRFCVLQLVAYS